MSSGGCHLQRVTPAKAGTHEHGVAGRSRHIRSWIPASAGMTLVWASPFVLAACDRNEPANNQATANAAAPQPEGAVGRAERLVREQLGNPQGLAFVNPRRSASEGVPIICGEYRQGASSHRYIVVDGEDVFVEPRMVPGEMDRAFGEFCDDGVGQNGER